MHNNSKQEETQRRKHIISTEKIQKIKCVLKTKEIEARRIIWQQVGNEVAFDYNGCIVECIIRIINYHKCIVCYKR